MRSADLTSEQLRQVRQQLVPLARKLRQIRERMHERGFEPNDVLLAKVKAADDAIHSLMIDLHYRSCAPGSVGRGPEKSR